MTLKLPADATLRDLKLSASERESFVRRAFGVIHQAAKDDPNVVLRLGVTGTGQAPNYRLEKGEAGTLIMAINGANHQPWNEGDKFDGSCTWSEATMSKADVEGLLGEIRNFSRKR